MIATTPRDTRPLVVVTWAQAYGLTHLANPGSPTIGLIGPARDGLDRAYAMTADLTKPAIVAPLSSGQPASPLRIDGTQRLYRA